MGICKWVVRERTNNSYWAFAPCKPGFNYLSKTHRVDEIEEVYNEHICPICGNKIVCNMELVRELSDGNDRNN